MGEVKGPHQSMLFVSREPGGGGVKLEDEDGRMDVSG